MRKAHKRAAEGPQPDDGMSGVYTSALPRRTRRRRQAMIGALGLVAILGAGTLTASQLIDDADTTKVSDAGAPAPMIVPKTSESAAAPVVPSVGASSSEPPVAASANPSPSTAKAKATPVPSSLSKIVSTARSANAKAGTEVRRPLPTPTARAAARDSDVTVTESGSLAKDRATLRIVSAPMDLTGQRELAWAADDGQAVGRARCTDKFRFSLGAPVKTKPTLLLCWRISAKKTVYAVAVNVAGKPSRQASVAAINKTWASLD